MSQTHNPQAIKGLVSDAKRLSLAVWLNLDLEGGAA